MNKLYVGLAIAASFGFGTIFGANKILKYQRDYINKERARQEFIRNDYGRGQK